MSEPRARLGAELRRIRLAAGLPQHEIGSLNQTVVSRIENGRRLPTRPQVDLWLEHGSDTDRDTVVALLAGAQRETSTWSEMLRGRSHLQDEIRDRNSAAARIRSFQPTVLPGLLQTADYARRVLRLGRTDVGQAVAARVASQHMLYEPDRRFEFLVSTDVLRCDVAPEARESQMHQLRSVATLETVEIRVLPARPPRIPWNNFVIRDPNDDSPRYVTVELVHGRQEIADPEIVRTYDDVWDDLWTSAAPFPGPPDAGP